MFGPVEAPSLGPSGAGVQILTIPSQTRLKQVEMITMREKFPCLIGKTTIHGQVSSYVSLPEGIS